MAKEKKAEKGSPEEAAAALSKLLQDNERLNELANQAMQERDEAKGQLSKSEKDAQSKIKKLETKLGKLQLYQDITKLYDQLAELRSWKQIIKNHWGNIIFFINERGDLTVDISYNKQAHDCFQVGPDPQSRDLWGLVKIRHFSEWQEVHGCLTEGLQKEKEIEELSHNIDPLLAEITQLYQALVKPSNEEPEVIDDGTDN